jgi:hypothetical protein
MTDPTHDDRPDPSTWRLLLDEGDGLEVRLAARSKESTSEPPDIRLWLSAGRAYDLSRVLRAYNRMVAIFTEASQVSGTEESLARALGDAAAAAVGRSGTPPEPSKVGSGERLKAMAVLQEARPELSHSTLLAIVDAAAWWLDNDKDHMATDLLEAVAPGDVAQQLYTTLLNWEPPAAPPERETEPTG